MDRRRNAASAIYGGGVGLVATTPSNMAAYLYTSASAGAAMAWQHIGGGGAQFVESSDEIMGLTSDRSAVYEWSGTGTAWTKIGGAAQAISANVQVTGTDLIAATPGNTGVYGYSGTPGRWSRIGDAAAAWANCGGPIGLGSVDGPAYHCVGHNDDGPPWYPMGGPFASLHCLGTE